MAALSRQLSSKSLVYLLCLCSGVAGLTYEVIWLRLLAAALGNASAATATVLAAVMTGFGLGGLIAGRIADRVEPLRLYGVLEVGLGCFALIVPTLATTAGELSPQVLRIAGDGWLGSLLRFLIASTVVLVPACLMGATVPVLARFVELRTRGRDDPVGPSVGALYGLNTVGAAFGCGLAGYFLLGRFGIRGTGFMAAAIDVAVGVIAIALSSRLARDGSPPRKRGHPLLPSPLPGALVITLAAVSGFCMLALEGLWTRLLLIVFGHDIHAFSSMLAVVLVGLAIGAAGYSVAPRRIRASPALAPTLFACFGVSVALSLGLTGRAYLSSGLDIFGVIDILPVTRSHEQGLMLQPIFAAALILAPAIISGAILPALCAVYRVPAHEKQHDDGLGAGNRVGRVFAANTLGAILGSIAPMLVLVPGLGLQRSFAAVSAITVAACLVLMGFVGGLSTMSRWLGLTVAILALALSMASVPYGLPQRALSEKIGPRHLDYLMYEEGRTGTVAVVENRINGERQLFVNGVNEVTTRLVHDQSFKLLGHLGLLLHPDPEDVLVICLGAGLSAGAAATHDVESLEIVDLEHSVEHAARLFRAENNEVLEDERVRLVFDDGRNYLRTTPTSYDVIIVDSTHPRAVDSWILYTLEFYEAAAARLDAGGYLVQWLPLHGLSVDEQRIIIHTFLTVFPRASLWVNAGFEPYGQAAYILLLGPSGEGAIDRDVLERRISVPSVRQDLVPWSLHTPAEILECFIAGHETLTRWVGHMPINTDDLPHTQFVTPFSNAAPMTAARLLEVREPVAAFLDPPLGADDQGLAAELRRRYQAQGFVLAGLLERAVEVCPDDCQKLPLFLMAQAQGPLYYSTLASTYETDSQRVLEIAAGLRQAGRGAEAVDILERATTLDRTNARHWLNLGIALADRDDPAGARRALRTALFHDPDMVLARINLGLLEARAGSTGDAVADLQRAVEIAPDLPEAQAGLGFALMAADRPSLAERHLRRALALDPRHRDARVNLGRLLLSTDRVDAAVNTFRVGWRLYPYDSDVLYNLGLSLIRSGEYHSALRVLSAAVRVNPDDREARELLSVAVANGRAHEQESAGNDHDQRK